MHIYNRILTDRAKLHKILEQETFNISSFTIHSGPTALTFGARESHDEWAVGWMEFQLTDFTSVVSYCGELLQNDSFHSLFRCAARLGLEPTFLKVFDVAITLGVPVQESSHVLYRRAVMYYTGEQSCTVQGSTHVLYRRAHMYCTGEQSCTVQGSTHVLYRRAHMYCTGEQSCTVQESTHVLYRRAHNMLRTSHYVQYNTHHVQRSTRIVQDNTHILYRRARVMYTTLIAKLQSRPRAVLLNTHYT